jgi:hypothetical protein
MTHLANLAPHWPLPESTPTRQADILRAIKAILTDGSINDLTEDDVTISASMEPPGGPAGMRRHFHVVLWIIGGQFRSDAYDGGGIFALQEEAGVSLTIWRLHFEDRTGGAQGLLLRDDTGLLELKRQILRRLIQGARLQWKQKFILNGEMMPLRSNHEDSESESGRPGQAYIELLTPFTWDLT